MTPHTGGRPSLHQKHHTSPPGRPNVILAGNNRSRRPISDISSTVRHSSETTGMTKSTAAADHLPPDDPLVLVLSAYARLSVEVETRIRAAAVASLGDHVAGLWETPHAPQASRYWVELNVNGEPLDGFGCPDLAQAARAAQNLIREAKLSNAKLVLPSIS